VVFGYGGEQPDCLHTSHFLSPPGSHFRRDSSFTSILMAEEAIRS
jgi:hypothetical protein